MKNEKKKHENMKKNCKKGKKIVKNEKNHEKPIREMPFRSGFWEMSFEIHTFR